MGKDEPNLDAFPHEMGRERAEKGGIWAQGWVIVLRFASQGCQAPLKAQGGGTEDAWWTSRPVKTRGLHQNIPHGHLFSFQTPAKPSSAGPRRRANLRTARPSASPPWWPPAGVGVTPTTTPSTGSISTSKAPAPTPWPNPAGATPGWCPSRWRPRTTSEAG